MWVAATLGGVIFVFGFEPYQPLLGSYGAGLPPAAMCARNWAQGHANLLGLTVFRLLGGTGCVDARIHLVHPKSVMKTFFSGVDRAA